MNKVLKKAVAAVMAVALVLGGVMFHPAPNLQAKAKKVRIAKSAKVTVGKTVKVKLKNNRKKVKWKVIAGKKRIKIVKKSKTYAAVKGLKKGKSKIQAVIGKKKYTCKVTVVAKKKPSVSPNEAKTDEGGYSYEVIPLMPPFNSYFYIKTNNPDPDSFRFVDKETPLRL